jgi:hypothetical protein
VESVSHGDGNASVIDPHAVPVVLCVLCDTDIVVPITTTTTTTTTITTSDVTTTTTTHEQHP